MPNRDLVMLQLHSSARELIPPRFSKRHENARANQFGQLTTIFARGSAEGAFGHTLFLIFPSRFFCAGKKIKFRFFLVAPKPDF
jgi:hypothetical protein